MEKPQNSRGNDKLGAPRVYKHRLPSALHAAKEAWRNHMATICPKITFLAEYPPRGIAGCVEIAALKGWGRLWKHKMLDLFSPEAPGSHTSQLSPRARLGAKKRGKKGGKNRQDLHTFQGIKWGQKILFYLSE